MKPPVLLLGTPFQVCLFFAANPDEELNSFDVAEKFDIAQPAVNTVLSAAIKAGLLSRRVGGGHVLTVYTAGPALLAHIKAPAYRHGDVVRVRRTAAGHWERKERGMAPAQWHEAIAA